VAVAAGGSGSWWQWQLVAKKYNKLYQKA